MISARLIGVPTCRRYQKMREVLMVEAARLDLPIDLYEINDTPHLMQFNPLSLPQLHIEGELAAAGNPPTAADVERRLQEVAAQQ
jgi:hypothetical protein